MKTILTCLLFLYFFLATISISVAQQCPDGSVHLFDQSSVDQFSTEYPDCETISGSLTISGSIDNLNGLSNIRTIKEDLIIENNTGLEDLFGLQQLDTVYGNLIISQLLNLSSLDDITSIKYIGGQFAYTANELITEIDTFTYLDSLTSLIILNSNLASLHAFSQVRYIDRLTLTGNNQLTSLDGLSDMLFVKHLQLSGNMQLVLCTNSFICESLHNPAVTYYIQNNGTGCHDYFDILEACQVDCPAGFYFSSQAELDEFVFPTATCDQIRGNIHVHDASNTPITDLGHLLGITHIDSNLVISGNPELSSLIGLGNLEFVGGDLLITDNLSLISLQELSHLHSVGHHLTLSGSQMLTDLDGLNGLVHIGGDLQIGNNSLEHLTGLNNLNTVRGNVLITNEALLTSLEGLDQLTSINGYFFLLFNHALQSLDGISSLTRIGGLHSGYNNSLQQMDALAGITSIPGDITIYENPALLRMPILPQVDSLGGFLQLYRNDEIKNLQGFNSFQSIGGRVEIRDMPAFESLAGLENVTHIDGHLYLSKTGIHNLDPLHNLLSMNGSLIVVDNENLTSIVGLDQVDPSTILPTVYYHLRLTGNDLLELCSSVPVCAVLQNDDNLVYIEENSSGCDSEEEVLTGCVIGVKDVENVSHIKIFPNPAVDEVNIEVSEISDPIETLEVYNLVGMQLHKGLFHNSFSFSSYSAGNYFMILRSKNDEIFRQHIVITRG